MRPSRVPRVTALSTAGYLLAWLCFGMSACGDPSPPQRDPAVPFRHAVIDAAPPPGDQCCTDVIAVGDLSGDGHPDVVVGSENAPRAGLVWYEYPSWERHPVASGQFTTDGQVADVDGDGRLDIVVSDLRGDSGTIYWFGRTTERDGWTPHRIAPGYAHDLEVADLDGDGDVDVVTCDKERVVALEQVSPDQWRAHVLLVHAGEGLAVADLDDDGDADVLAGSWWLDSPGRLGPDWPARPLAAQWSPMTRVRVADIDGDSRSDVVLSVSEGRGPLIWLQAPADRAGGTWVERVVEPAELEGAHSLQVGDVDNDGDLDLVTAEMHTSKRRRVVIYLQEPGLAWTKQVLSIAGSHNLRLADIGGDGDLDLVGKNFDGVGRTVELWENLTADNLGRLPAGTVGYIDDGWRYVAVDSARPSSQLEKTGLVFADVDGDARTDIVAGSLVYLNPGTALNAPWDRLELPEAIDVYLAVDVDGDDRIDLIGAADSLLFWVEARGTRGEWEVRPIATVPAARTQGYASGQLEPGGPPELVFTRGNQLIAVAIPSSDPEAGSWPLVTLSSESQEEGIALGDIDRDGGLDIAGVHQDGHRAVWYRNGGTLSAKWEQHVIGPSATWLDRVALTDLNDDGRLDLVATEETRDWAYNANVYWYEAPEDPRSPWRRHTVTTLRSANSLGVADMDGDGDDDLVVAEHTDQRSAEAAPDNLTVIFENLERGSRWRPHPIEIGGHSSHLGARLHDLDGDGDLDVVSIPWRQSAFVHLWENLAGAW